MADGALNLRMTEAGDQAAMRGSEKCAAELGLVKPSTRNAGLSIPGDDLPQEEGRCPTATKKEYEQAVDAAYEPKVVLGAHTTLPFKTQKHFSTPLLKCTGHVEGSLDGPPQTSEDELASIVKVRLARSS
ncbi:MAG TPA: hypothetical protein VKV16_06245 [Solirubrobacteraceae bacterium]|nr:hypothetical protein [Solirubrobacteraceae bacterium]